MALLFIGSSGEHVSTVKFQRKVRVFHQVTGEHEDNRFVWLYESLLYQLLQSSQRHRGSWFAPNSLGTDFGFSQRNLDFTHLLNRAFRFADHSQSLFSRRWVADAYRGGHGVGMHRNEFLSPGFANCPYQRIRALRLND